MGCLSVPCECPRSPDRSLEQLPGPQRPEGRRGRRDGEAGGAEGTVPVACVWRMQGERSVVPYLDRPLSRLCDLRGLVYRHCLVAMFTYYLEILHMTGP